MTGHDHRLERHRKVTKHARRRGQLARPAERARHGEDDRALEIQTEGPARGAGVHGLVELGTHGQAGGEHAIGGDAASHEVGADALRGHAVEIDQGGDPLAVDGKIAVHEGVGKPRDAAAAQDRQGARGRRVRGDHEIGALSLEEGPQPRRSQ